MTRYKNNDILLSYIKRKIIFNHLGINTLLDNILKI